MLKHWVIFFAISFSIVVISKVQACQVCYGSADPGSLWPVNLAILSMLFLVAAVLGTFGWFFVQCWRRSRRFVN